MSARRRRAALSAVGALIAALICAVLASSVDSSTHRGILIALSLAWLVIAGTCVAGVLRTESATPAATETSALAPQATEEPTGPGYGPTAVSLDEPGDTR
ncbi:MAG: hypothetical protein JWN77_911 [Frankiales bacterium]|jgi:hypothetical protein|nr:hypothetical protein [Frankiales bacterium]